MSRRHFLHGATMAAAGVSPGTVCMRRAFAADSSPTPSWIDKPMRWAQLTLVEDAPGKFDAPFWLDYFERTKSDAVCLSA